MKKLEEYLKENPIVVHDENKVYETLQNSYVSAIIYMEHFPRVSRIIEKAGDVSSKAGMARGIDSLRKYLSQNMKVKFKEDFYREVLESTKATQLGIELRKVEVDDIDKMFMSTHGTPAKNSREGKALLKGRNDGEIEVYGTYDGDILIDTFVGSKREEMDTIWRLASNIGGSTVMSSYNSRSTYNNYIRNMLDSMYRYRVTVSFVGPRGGGRIRYGTGWTTKLHPEGEPILEFAGCSLYM